MYKAAPVFEMGSGKSSLRGVHIALLGVCDLMSLISVRAGGHTIGMKPESEYRGGGGWLSKRP